MSINELRRDGRLSGIRVLDCAPFLATPVASLRMLQRGRRRMMVGPQGFFDTKGSLAS